MFLIKTKDNKVFEIEEQLAFKSNFIRNLYETTQITDPIDVLIDSDTFTKVYSFMQNDNHVLKKGYNPLEIYFSSENMSFMASMSAEEIIKITTAANYLDYPFLLELGCKFIANEIANSSRGELAEIVKGNGSIDNRSIKPSELDIFDEDGLI